MGELVHYGDIPPAVGVMAVARLLEVAQPMMIMQRFGQVTTLPRKRGDTVKWTRYERFAAALARIAEGVSPAAQPLRKREYVAQVVQYGAITRITDVVEELHPDNPLDIAVKLSAQQMAETEEVLTLELLKGAANRYFGSGVAGRTDVNKKITAGDFARVARGFARANVKKINRFIAPTVASNTFGVPETYIAIVHVDQDSDVRLCTKFRGVAEYGDPMKRVDGEIGAVGAFRVIASNLLAPIRSAGKVSADMLSAGEVPVGEGTAADIYPVLCLGQDAYGVVRLQGAKAAHVMVLQPGVARGGDEMGQRGSVAWKMWYASAILNDDAVAVIEVACSASPEL